MNLQGDIGLLLKSRSPLNLANLILGKRSSFTHISSNQSLPTLVSRLVPYCTCHGLAGTGTTTGAGSSSSHRVVVRITVIVINCVSSKQSSHIIISSSTSTSSCDSKLFASLTPPPSRCVLRVIVDNVGI